VELKKSNRESLQEVTLELFLTIHTGGGDKKPKTKKVNERKGEGREK
jgi:hypothetical protein